jgi:regulatory protein YycH of two-component signal transduction system YycFG
MSVDKLKTVGVIIILGVILTTLGVMSVVLMPFYWIWSELQDYMDRKEVDVPNYLSGKSSKDRD